MEHGVEQVFLVAEVGVDQRLVGRGGGCDAVDPGPGDAPLGELGRRGFQQPSPGVSSVPRHAPSILTNQLVVGRPAGNVVPGFYSAAVPVERWSIAHVTALAPDASSLKGARGVSSAGKWQEAGLLDEVLWGLCKGSGKNPYQVCVDLAGPGLQVLLPEPEVPLQARARAAPALGLGRPGRPHRRGTGLRHRVAGEPQGAKRLRRRPAPRIRRPPENARSSAPSGSTGGMAELRRWLDDQVQQGLAGAQQAGRQPYDTMAARLVDAQAPTVASAVRRLGGVAGIGPHWADRLLGGLAMIRLLVSGHERLDTLPPALAATVRSRIGFPVAQEDVLATPPVRDRWQVLGQVDSDEGAITTRRTWLLGAATGRFALMLSFAAPGQSLAADLVPGSVVEAALCFYPGAAPLRALVRERFGAPRPLTAPAGATGLREALAGWATAVAAEPWRSDVPMLLAGVVPSARRVPHRRRRRSRCRWRPGIVSPGGCWRRPVAHRRPSRVSGHRRACGRSPPGSTADTCRRPRRCRTVRPGGHPSCRPSCWRRRWWARLAGPGHRQTVHIGERTLTTAGAAPALLEAAATALTYRRAGVTPASGHAPVEAALAEIDPPLPAGRRSPAGADAHRRRGARRRSAGPGAAGPVAGGGRRARWARAARDAARPAGRRPAQRGDPARAGQGRGPARAPGWRRCGPTGDGCCDEAPGAGRGRRSGDVGDRHGGRAARVPRRGCAAPIRPPRSRCSQSTWPTEASEDRARFVAALETGLSLADDAFLDQALDDRRKEVREAALEPAAPASRVGAGSADGRARPRGGALARARPDRLVVRPPAELTPELRRDGVGATAGAGHRRAARGCWRRSSPARRWRAGRPLSAAVRRRWWSWLAATTGRRRCCTAGPRRRSRRTRPVGCRAGPQRHRRRRGRAARGGPVGPAPGAAAGRAGPDRGRLPAPRGPPGQPAAGRPPGRVAGRAGGRGAGDDRAPRPDRPAQLAAGRAVPGRRAGHATAICGARRRLAGAAGPAAADQSRVRPVADLARTLAFRHEMLQELRDRRTAMPIRCRHPSAIVEVLSNGLNRRCPSRSMAIGRQEFE